MARAIIGTENYIEIYVNAPLNVCEQRDVKGLYAKARQGLIKDFTGIGSAFEQPLESDIEVHTDLQTIEQSVKQILDYILPLVKFREDKN
jgi:adenylylsulfate kinase-like enzyme